MYSDDTIDEVKSRNDIVDVVGGYVNLKKNGSRYFGLCPFHNEKTPSFSVTPSKQMYYCYGCHSGGNVITFIMNYENMTFVEALKYLAERAGVQLPEQSYDRGEKKNAQQKKILLDIHREAAYFYYKALYSPEGSSGLAYLKGRGLTDETIRKFGLGFSPVKEPSLYSCLKKAGYTDSQLKDSGLVKFSERGVRDSFWNRVMFPIMDKNNKVIAFGGRVMGEGEPKYLNSPETKIFDKSRNLYGLNDAKKSRRNYFLICEGYMDVISLHQAGFTNAVAALGTAFTDQHASEIKKYVRDVVLTFDSDGAGIKAALRAIPILGRAGIGVKVLCMKPYKDPDEFIKASGADEYQKRIDSAKNAFIFEMECEWEKTDKSDPGSKTRFHEFLAASLLRFEDKMERDNYMEAVCLEFKIDLSAMLQKVKTVGAKMSAASDTAYEKPKKPVHYDESQRDERVLITWICEEPQIYQKISDIIAPEDFSTKLCQKVAGMVFEQAGTGSVDTSGIINSFIDDESYNQVSGMFVTNLPEEIASLNRNKAITEMVVNIKRRSLKKKLNGGSLGDAQAAANELKELQSLHIVLDGE